MSFAAEAWAALLEYLKYRKAGVSKLDAVRGVEAIIRETWPLPPTKFEPRCQNCEDTGWSERLCWDQERCGRRFCGNHSEYEHRYVEPCFCLAGERHKARIATVDDAIARAGKTAKKKPSGFSRV